MDFNIFKIEYDWYEGEHEETLLGKNIDKKKFEKDLIEAKKFAISLIGNEIKSKNYLGKGYSVECLPEFYEQIIWFLINKKGYIKCNFDENTGYQKNPRVFRMLENPTGFSAQKNCKKQFSVLRKMNFSDITNRMELK